MLLLRVQAGSRLYGYSSPESDDDYFEVHSEPFMIETRLSPRPVRQTIVEGVDTIQMTLSHFVERAMNGSHQALDAMFASEPLVDLIPDLRAGYHAGYEIVPAYERIITKFALQEGFRKQRHAIRAAFNLSDMLSTGRYEPELSLERIDYIMSVAPLPSSEFIQELKRISPIELDFKNGLIQ